MSVGQKIEVEEVKLTVHHCKPCLPEGAQNRDDRVPERCWSLQKPPTSLK
jgi:hypothetical protein